MVDEFTHDWISYGFDSIENKNIRFMIYDILNIYVNIALIMLFYLLWIYVYHINLMQFYLII